MPLTDKKISESEFTGNDITGLSNTPSADGMGASALKLRFDSLVKLVLIPKYNQLIDMLVSVVTGSSGARQIGMEATPEFLYQNVHDALIGLNTTKVDKITGKGLSTEDYSTEEKSKLSGIEAGAEVNNISDVNALDLTDGGDTTLHAHDGRYYTETEVDALISGIVVPAHTHDDRYYTETEADTLLGNKVDKVTGKGLSTEDYSTAEKSKLAGIEAGAETNNISDVNATDLTDGGDTTLHTHDGRYYTETEIDLMMGDVSSALDAILGGA